MPDFIQSHDFLSNSTSLLKARAHRVFFDPSLQSHLDSFDHFLRTGNWGEVHFFCEAPYSEVPMTVLMKFACYEQSVTRETYGETRARLETMNLTVPVKETRAKA